MTSPDFEEIANVFLGSSPAYGEGQYGDGQYGGSEVFNTDAEAPQATEWTEISE